MAIDNDTCVVQRGAMYTSPTGIIQANSVTVIVLRALTRTLACVSMLCDSRFSSTFYLLLDAWHTHTHFQPLPQAFKGFNAAESAKLSNYLLFRDPQSTATLNKIRKLGNAA